MWQFLFCVWWRLHIFSQKTKKLLQKWYYCVKIYSLSFSANKKHCKKIMESWLSGRKRRSWKPLYWKVSGVRIPNSPPKPYIFVGFFVIKNFLIFCFRFKIGVKIGVKKCVLKYIYFKCFLSSSYCIIFEFYFWLNFHQCPCKCPLLK